MMILHAEAWQYLLEDSYSYDRPTRRLVKLHSPTVEAELERRLAVGC